MKFDLIGTKNMKTDNQLIAEFMGLDVNGNQVTDGQLETTLDKLKYNTSWDWLMPVVEKIEHIKGTCVYIESQTACFITFFGKVVARGKDTDTKIASVHKAVVEFIKFHNSQNSLIL